jgi:hypothetical protein
MQDQGAIFLMLFELIVEMNVTGSGMTPSLKNGFNIIPFSLAQFLGVSYALIVQNP